MEETFDWADFLQRFSTNVLWHFTGYNKGEEESLAIIKKIIEEKKLRIGKSPVEVLMKSGERRWGHCCSCMCDIPFKDLRIHTARYGKYGIAFDKIKAITDGQFNPVLYIHKDHIFFKYTEEELLPHIDFLTGLNKPGQKLLDYLVLLGTYMKRSNLTAPISIGDQIVDYKQNNNFYYEREWRAAYDWDFEKDDIETIMVQRKNIKDIRDFLEKHEMSDVPVVTYEMLLKV